MDITLITDDHISIYKYIYIYIYRYVYICYNGCPMGTSLIIDIPWISFL